MRMDRNSLETYPRLGSNPEASVPQGVADATDLFLAKKAKSRSKPTPPPGGIVNAMSVDVEDYFQVSAFENYISRESWDKLECRVEKNVDQILASFDANQVKATFFTLGWIAARYPSMIKRIVAEGHELASHGWEHVRVIHQERKQFAKDVSRTKKTLEDISGSEVLGYRAASYSINRSNLWAHDILTEAGYVYSSSIAPIKYAQYGIEDAPRFAHYRQGEKVVQQAGPGAILEIPISTLSIPKKNIPCGGGGWFRLYPYKASKWAIQWVNTVDKQPCIFYFHPWEIDPDQPRQANLDLKTRFRHYQNLNSMQRKIDSLLADFEWGRMVDVFDIKSRENQHHENVIVMGGSS